MTGLRLVLVALFVTVTIVTDLSQAQLEPSLKKEYTIKNKLATWDEARRLCEEANMSLATVMNANDQGLLRTTIKNNNKAWDAYWIAATNEGCRAGEYCWFGKPETPVVYSNWAAFSGLVGILQIFSQESCVKVFSKDATWYYVDCNHRLAFVCESYT